MPKQTARHKSRLLRNAYGSTAAEAFMIVTILTILITRLYLEISGYPQVGSGSLHIAHALYGGALMMVALLLGWIFLGFGVRVLCILVGGIGFGLFLDEIGKFVTKDNDYFFAPSAVIMYILVAVVLVLARVVRDARPPSAQESLANAATIAAEGVARGLPEQRREWAIRMVDRAQADGADPVTTASIRTLLEQASPVSARLLAARQFAVGLVPGFFRSPRWILIVGWLLVVVSMLGVVFGALGAVFNGVVYQRDDVTVQADELGLSGIILLVSAAITFVLALPAMIALHRTARSWPLRCLREAALIFTMLNALVDFATEGFAAVGNLAIGLFALAILSYQLNLRIAQAAAPAPIAATP